VFIKNKNLKDWDRRDFTIQRTEVLGCE
jgi:hypothetical protein